MSCISRVVVFGVSFTIMLLLSNTESAPTISRRLRGVSLLDQITEPAILCTSGQYCNQYGGVCSSDDGMCTCRDGWQGASCDIRVVGRCGVGVDNLCNPSQGVCDEEEGVCACKLGWTGPTCQEDMDECSQEESPACSFPGAYCVDEDPELGNMYFCYCDETQGWLSVSADANGATSCECDSPLLGCGGTAQPPSADKEVEVGGNETAEVQGLCIDDNLCPRWKDTQSSVCNTETGFCECVEGYFRANAPILGVNDVGNPEWNQGTSCMNENECEPGNNNCGSNAGCVDLEPLAAALAKYACFCHDGFEQDQQSGGCVAVHTPSTSIPTLAPTLAPQPQHLPQLTADEPSSLPSEFPSDVPSDSPT